MPSTPPLACLPEAARVRDVWLATRLAGEYSRGLPLLHRNALVSLCMSSVAHTIETVWGGTLFVSQRAKSSSVSSLSTSHGKVIAMERHTILVPTDVSTYAEHAWREALAIAMRDKAQVLLLH